MSATGQLSALARELLTSHFEEPCEEVLPGSGILALHAPTAVAVVAPLETDSGLLQLSVTVGLGRDVPRNEAITRWVNDENRAITFGRVFYLEQADSPTLTLLFQGFIPADALSWDNVPAVQNAFTLLEYIVRRGWIIAGQVVPAHGGVHLTPTDALLVSMLG